MAERVLFVDLENVQHIDLAHVQPGSRVLIFCGVDQKHIPAELVMQAQPFGTRLKWIRMAGHGHNALDFHIAFYLGQELAANPALECTVLSRDTGFDPLMRHLTALGHRCSRVAALREPPQRPAQDPFARLLMLLKKHGGRPGRTSALTASVRSWFPSLGETERRALMHRLFAQKLVQESGTGLTYHLERADSAAVCTERVSSKAGAGLTAHAREAPLKATGPAPAGRAAAAS